MFAQFRRIAAVGIALALSLFASNARAQAIFGAAEVDDKDLLLLLLGGAWAPGGLGWKPYGSVVGYHLRYDAGIADVDRNVVVPTLGLMNARQDQSIEFGVGYAFSDDDDDTPVLAAAPSGDGVVGSFGWNYWGMTGRRMTQVLAAYNFGNQYLWSRGRFALPLTATSPLWVGGEAALMGGGDSDLDGDGSNDQSWLAQVGPMIEYRFTPKFRLGASAGMKFGFDDFAPNNAVYGRIEFLFLPGAR